MAIRTLVNVKSGVILPWNEHLAKHPDMREHEYEPEPRPIRRANKPRKKLSLPKKKPSPPIGDASIDDLLEGLD